MNIKDILFFTLTHRWIIILFSVGLMLLGIWSFLNIKIEAYPDIADTNVIVITKFDGRAAEEVEQQISIPIERALNNVPNVISRRSRTIFGLSVVQLSFEDGIDDYFARQQVFQRLSEVELPPDVSPEIAPLTSAVGEILRYVIEAPPSFTPMQLRDLQDWVIVPKLLQTSGIADITTFGGPIKQFHILMAPTNLRKYNLKLQDVIEAIEKNNQNTGGNIIERGAQGFAVRGIGNLRDIEDIENIILTTSNGVPIFIKDVASIEINPPPASGILGYSIPEEKIDFTAGTEGIVLLRRYENPSEVLKTLKQNIKDLEENDLPAGVKIRIIYDRSFLIDHSLETVGHTLLEGITISLVVIFLFLGSFRSALVVAITIPFSLLFAFVMMKFSNIPANLLSLGAIDFGIIVDGAGRMAENMIRRIETAKPHEKEKGIIAICISAAQEVGREIFFCVGIIILAYLPIFMMQRVEGKLFTPMALTVAFALLGSVICALTLIPVLISYTFSKALNEHKKRKWYQFSVFKYLQNGYSKGLDRVLTHPWWLVGGVTAYLVIAGLFISRIGTEFLPRLDEGSIFLRCNLPAGVNIQETAKISPIIRKVVSKYTPVDFVITQAGRNDDGTDPFPANRTEVLIGLKEYSLWADSIAKNDLIEWIRSDLEKHLPGVSISFGQPIIDQVMEIVTGSAADLAVSVVGADLKLMRQKADSILHIVRNTRGAAGYNIEQEGRQEQITISINRKKAARYGINVADIQLLIEAAIGGKAVSVLYEGAKRYDIIVRYFPENRNTIESLQQLQVPSANGSYVPIKEVAKVAYEEGETNIYRLDGKRMVTVRTNIVNRDQGGFVNELREKISAQIKLPEGYRIIYGGQFENLERAGKQLLIVIPLTLVIVFVVLFILFKSFKDTMIVFLCVPLGLTGGAMALILRGYNFNISAGVGFISLFGISVMAGIMIVSFLNNAFEDWFRESAQEKKPTTREQARHILLEVCQEQLRPQVMVLIVAILALIPAARSSGIGSDVQRPLATVIIGGLTTTLLLAPLVIPTIYWLFVGKNPQPDVEEEIPLLDGE